MPDIACPECGKVTRLVAIRRSADEFCTHCDYPLFWAPTAVAVGVGDESTETTMRRLPGAGGRQQLGSRVCPECGELNTLLAVYCIRCDAEMDPAPAPPPPPPEPPPPPPEPVAVKAPPWWPWPAGVAVATVAAIVALALIT
jgi:hypothetical protein